jgi:hypothetical protein
MTFVGFEHTVPASERAKTVHALDRSATVTGLYDYKVWILFTEADTLLIANFCVSWW